MAFEFSALSLSIGIGITAMRSGGGLGLVDLTFNSNQLTFNGVNLEYRNG